MIGFRIFLGVLFSILSLYTALTIADHGWGLLPIFFADIAAMDWHGQFNLDFMMMLMFSALWVAWRHRFSPAGLGLAGLALFGGSMILTVYLFALTLRSPGGMREVLLGAQADRSS